MNNPTPQLSIFLDARGFRRDYGLSERLYFHLIKIGEFTAYKPSRRLTLVKRSDVEKWIEKSRAGADLNKIVTEVIADVLAR
jgi:hypothetical protein